MYKLKPYYNSDAAVELPNCMYKIKSYTDEKITTESENPNMDANLLAQLEQKQEAILRKLEELKAEVTQLVKTTGASTSSTGEVLTDLVISAHPSHPPASLLVLQQLLATQFKVLTACHCHSSVKNVPVSVRNIFGLDNNTVNRSQYQLCFTLMWKDVKHGPTLMVSPKSQVLVEGEGTVARHLARLLNPSYDNGDIVMATEIDQWVDTASEFSRGNSKEKKAILKTMNTKLGKGDWLVGNERSLADIMMWSVLLHNQDVGNNVAAWVNRCNGLEEFSNVLKQLENCC